MKQRIKHLNIKPQDFTNREYYPGTEEHPFNAVNTLNAAVEKLPAPFYAILFSSITYIISGDLPKTLLIGAAILLDWLLLTRLPKLHISYGPPTLTLVMLGALRLPFLLLPFPLALGFQVLGSLLVVYAFYLEPQFPRLESYEVTLSGRHHAGSLRIVHLSDLHMAYFSKREERAIEMVNALTPDLILFTGDFFNLSNQDDPQTVQDIHRFFTQLKTEYGIYGVTGSPAVDLEDSMKKLPSEPGLRILNNETLTLQIDSISVRLVGLSCTQQPDPDAERLAAIMSAPQPDADAVILLYHAPDLAPLISAGPIDLQLSGHTHGGQVQLPIFGPVFTGSLYGLRFTSGFYQINQGLKLILSRGLGLEGNAAPRVRFLAPPEIGLITIEIQQDTVE